MLFSLPQGCCIFHFYFIIEIHKQKYVFNIYFSYINLGIMSKYVICPVVTGSEPK
jgi:hypothetical protein